ncbi:hypothetical protein AC579_6679 [Pseudocercospora musae]|uniref:Uncharacterized protein n=1 Tax=Pseudocercospora musae TaxID=113226 RepID=A0A139IPF8_9PEZI|nr:hypothetical protein AC579_6679 [Pseudocercospora musae]
MLDYSNVGDCDASTCPRGFKIFTKTHKYWRPGNGISHSPNDDCAASAQIGISVLENYYRPNKNLGLGADPCTSNRSIFRFVNGNSPKDHTPAESEELRLSSEDDQNSLEQQKIYHEINTATTDDIESHQDRVQRHRNFFGLTQPDPAMMSGALGDGSIEAGGQADSKHNPETALVTYDRAQADEDDFIRNAPSESERPRRVSGVAMQAAIQASMMTATQENAARFGSTPGDEILDGVIVERARRL